jgi:hypothetical protein
MAESSKQGRQMVSRHVRKHKKEGMGQRQAVAAALSEARRSGKKVSPRRRSSTAKGRQPSTSSAANRSRQSARAGRKSGGGRSSSGGRGASSGRKQAPRKSAQRKGGRAAARKRSR